MRARTAVEGCPHQTWSDGAAPPAIAAPAALPGWAQLPLTHAGPAPAWLAAGGAVVCQALCLTDLWSLGPLVASLLAFSPSGVVHRIIEC